MISAPPTTDCINNEELEDSHLNIVLKVVVADSEEAAMNTVVGEATTLQEAG
jgi:hypothetical protein